MDPADDRKTDMQDARVETFGSERYIVPYLKVFKKHQKFFKVFVNNINDLNADGFYQLLLKKLWIPSCESHDISDKVLITYMSKEAVSNANLIILATLVSCIGYYVLKFSVGMLSYSVEKRY